MPAFGLVVGWRKLFDQLALVRAYEARELVDDAEVRARSALRVVDDGVQVAEVARKDLLQEHAEVRDLVLVDRPDQHAVGLQQALGEAKALLHE